MGIARVLKKEYENVFAVGIHDRGHMVGKVCRDRSCDACAVTRPMCSENRIDYRVKHSTSSVVNKIFLGSPSGLNSNQIRREVN